MADSALGSAREERVRCEGVRDQTSQVESALLVHIKERLDCEPAAVLTTGGVEEGEELPAIEEAQTRFERLTRERDNMGPVNLVAEAEAAVAGGGVAGDRLDVERFPGDGIDAGVMGVEVIAGAEGQAAVDARAEGFDDA